MSDQNGRTWLVLGASSSVARAFARLVAAQGAAVLLAGRDVDDLERSASDLRARHGVSAHVLPFDARERATIAALVAHCRDLPAGTLDVFLAFGSMPEQAAMEADPTLAVHTIEATYTGAVEVLLGLAPLLEAGKQGHVVVLGSVAGDRGRLKNYVYGSAKAGLATFTAGLRNRLFRAGVLVTTVKPGFVDTAMTWGLPGLFLVASPD
ncbi:MAG: SDR family NAD(P)-dependent oxidoreductase, partial [Alphaproteobacteria bacterium]|nr:SDR family NAD(P)-dependent oxidoreductase [Alphaproteobacteria bacterium]